MLDDINKVWRDIEAIAFIKQHGCWNDCGGGRCCSNNIPELDFKFIHKNGTNIIYMDGEWNYLSHHGLVPSSSIQTHSLDFGGPQPLRIHQARCSLLGLCEGKLSKPLLCRTYPYVPQMDEAGNLLGLLPGSIFDLTAQTFGFDLPCSVSKGRQQTLEDWRGDADIMDIFTHPNVHFTLLVARAFAECYVSRLSNENRLAGLQGAAFWRTWEMLYLRRKFFDVSVLKDAATRAFKVIEARHPGFLNAEK